MPASPNPQPASDAAAPPAYQVYHMFFMHLANLDAFAAKLEADGKDGKRWRTHDERFAGLTADEGDTMRKVAFDCNKALEDQDKKIQDAIRAIRQQYPNTFPIVPPPELDQLWTDRTQIILSHMKQLQSLLGDSSFQKLDDYVQSNFHPVKQNLPSSAPLKSPNKGQGPSQ
jgi:hypothetical protein